LWFSASIFAFIYDFYFSCSYSYDSYSYGSFFFSRRPGLVMAFLQMNLVQRVLPQVGLQASELLLVKMELLPFLI